MSQIEKYQAAWNSYMNSCEKHGIETKINFIEFIRSITEEQAERMIGLN